MPAANSPHDHFGLLNTAVTTSRIRKPVGERSTSSGSANAHRSTCFGDHRGQGWRLRQPHITTFKRRPDLVKRSEAAVEKSDRHPGAGGTSSARSPPDRNSSGLAGFGKPRSRLCDSRDSAPPNRSRGKQECRSRYHCFPPSLNHSLRAGADRISSRILRTKIQQKSTPSTSMRWRNWVRGEIVLLGNLLERLNPHRNPIPECRYLLRAELPARSEQGASSTCSRSGCEAQPLRRLRQPGAQCDQSPHPARCAG